MAPEDLLKMPKGKCVLVNPAFASKGESYLPVQEKIVFSGSYLATLAKSQQLWSSIHTKLIARSPQISVSRRDLQQRYARAGQLYPLPKADSPTPSPPPNPGGQLGDFSLFT